MVCNSFHHIRLPIQQVFKIMNVIPILAYLNPGVLYFGCKSSLTQQLKDVGSSQAKFLKSLSICYPILMSRGWQMTWNSSIWMVTKVTNFFYKECWTGNTLSTNNVQIMQYQRFSMFFMKNQEVPHTSLFLDNEWSTNSVLRFLLNCSLLVVRCDVLGKWVHGFGQNQVRYHGIGQN